MPRGRRARPRTGSQNWSDRQGRRRSIRKPLPGCCNRRPFRNETAVRPQSDGSPTGFARANNSHKTRAGRPGQLRLVWPTIKHARLQVTRPGMRKNSQRPFRSATDRPVRSAQRPRAGMPIRPGPEAGVASWLNDRPGLLTYPDRTGRDVLAGAVPVARGTCVRFRQ